MMSGGYEEEQAALKAEVQALIEQQETA